jgi:predicted nucleic acid-binding protein
VKKLIFLDTSFLVAFTNDSDGKHQDAVKLADMIINEEMIVSNIVIIEVFNSLRNFKQGKLNQKVYQIIKDNFTIYQEDMELYDNALLTQVRYKGKLGFADCIIIEIMKKLNISQIASFDEHFDGKEGIIRVSDMN